MRNLKLSMSALLLVIAYATFSSCNRIGGYTPYTASFYCNINDPVKTVIERDVIRNSTLDLDYTTRYEFDNMGRMVGFTKSLGDRLISQQTIQYDAAGKIVQFSITDDYDSPIEYTPEYNEQGDLIKETCMHEEGFGSVTEYGYDAEGHVIMKKSYDCYAEDFVFDEGCYTFCEDSLHYTYDEGNRVKSIDEVITQDGSEQWHSDCDSLGSVISHRLVDFDYCQTYSFKYKLDERGNWIERESISSDGSTNITMREIIYQ